MFFSLMFLWSQGSWAVPADEKLEDVCSLAVGPVGGLCATLDHLASEDSEHDDAFGLAINEASSTAALGVLAELLTSDKSAPSDVNRSIRATLLDGGNASRFCATLEEKAKLSADVATVACIRPACLVAKDFDAIAHHCAPLKNESAKATRRTVAEFLADKKNLAESFGCGVPAEKGNTAVCVGAEAAELAVKVDQLLQFAKDLRDADLPALASCKRGRAALDCRNAMGEVLLKVGKTWASGTAISESFRREPTLVTSLDPGKAFNPRWEKVDRLIPSAEQLEKAENNPFPFDARFVIALLDSEASINDVLARMSNVLREGVSEKFARGKLVAAMLDKIPVAYDEPHNFGKCRLALEAWSSKELKADDEASAFELAGFLSENNHCVALAEEALIMRVSGRAKGSLAHACPNGVGVTQVDQGIADYCFKSGKRSLGPVGLRFNFRPCADIKDNPCVTVGYLSLLVRVGVNGQANVVDYPLGISDIQARITGRSVIILAIPPQVAYAPPDEGLMMESLQRLLPPAFSITALSSISLADNLDVSVRGMELSVAGLRLPKICATFSAGDLAFGDDPDCADPEKTTSSLAEAARRALENKFADTGPVSLAGVSVPLDELKVLRAPEDRCTANSEKLGDVAIAALDQLVAICGSARIDIGAGQSLPITILWQGASSQAAWRIFVDEAQARSVIQSKLPDVNVESIVSEAGNLRVRITESRGCRFTLDVGFSAAGVKSNLAETIAKLGLCKLEIADLPNLEQVTLLGLTFTGDGPRAARACLARELTPDGPTCIRNVRFDAPGKPNFKQAVLEDDGRLARLLQKRLDHLLPGGMVTILEVLPTLKARVVVPTLKPIEFEIRDFAESLEAVALSEFREGVAETFLKKPIDIGPVTVTGLRLLPPHDDIRKLDVEVEIAYGSDKLRTTLHVLPKLKLEPPPDAGAILAGIKQAFGGLQLPGNPDVIVGADGVPVVRVEVSLPVIANALQAAGTIEWRPGKNSKPRFNGPMTLTWAGYTPIFAGVDIGNISGSFDFENSENISLSASFALTGGDATNNLLRLTGTISYNKQARTITADSGFFLANTLFARSLTAVNLDQYSIESSLTSEGVAAYLPLPTVKVGIYGEACLASGKATVTLFKSFELADVVALIVLPKCASDLALQEQKIAALDSKECMGPTKSGLLCVAARFNVLSLFNGRGVVKTPLRSFSPVVDIDGDALGAHLNINASLKRIKVRADVKVLKVTVVFPSPAGIDARVLKKLLENLLRPSIDLQSLLDGDIVISPQQGKGGDGAANGKDGDEESTDSQADAKDGQAEKQTAAQARSTTRRAHAAPRGPGAKLAFSSDGLEVYVGKDNRIMHGVGPYKVRALEPDGTRSSRPYEVRVSPTTGKVMMSGGDKGLYLVPKASAFILADGAYLLFCNKVPCDAGAFVARKVELIRKSAAADDTEKAIPALEPHGGFGQEFSNETLGGALPRVMQRALASNTAPELLCASIEVDACDVALHRLQGETEWAYFPSRQSKSEKVQPGSLWAQALDILTPTGSIAFIASTRFHRVAAMTLPDADRNVRSLLLEPEGSFLRLFRSSARGRPPEFPGSYAIATISPSSPHGYYVEKVQSRLRDSAPHPWEAPPPEAPLTRVLGAIPNATGARTVWIDTSSDGRRAIADVQTAGARNIFYSIRNQARLCASKSQSVAQLTESLNIWASPPSFSPQESNRGRLEKGTDVSKLLETLSTQLTAEPFAAPFLVDPMLLFYPNGACR